MLAFAPSLHNVLIQTASRPDREKPNPWARCHPARKSKRKYYSVLTIIDQPGEFGLDILEAFG
jgi:hypothetical protein